MSDDLREKVARVIDQTAWEPMTGHVPIIRQAESLRKADAILNLIGGDGWALVPREPTDLMMDRGGTALFDARAKNVDALAAAAYRAMIAASPPPPVTP